MEEHEKFTEWALAQGVKINGVAAHRFPGRGLGIVAKEKRNVRRTISPVPLFHCSVLFYFHTASAVLLGYAPFSWLRSSDFVPSS